MVIRSHKVTAAGARIPITVQVTKVSPDTLISYQTLEKAERNGRCTQGKPCEKYNCRPCCPPKVKLFSEMTRKQHVYLVAVTLKKIDYFEYSPKTAEHKSRAFLFLGASHKLTRNICNSISFSFEGMPFKVGGCLGCQYSKTGICRRFAPMLEGTGINVIDLAKDIFDLDITWLDGKNPPDNMIAIGGVYTDEVIAKSKFKEVIENVLNKKR